MKYNLLKKHSEVVILLKSYIIDGLHREEFGEFAIELYSKSTNELIEDKIFEILADGWSSYNYNYI